MSITVHVCILTTNMYHTNNTILYTILYTHHIGYGLFQARFFRDHDEQYKLLSLYSLFILFFFGHWCIQKLERSLTYAARRFLSLALSTSITILIIYFIITHTLYLRYILASYFIFSAISAFFLLCGVPQIAYIYKIHDYLVGHTIFIILGILSTLQIGYLQTWLLYHNALSAGIVIYYNVYIVYSICVYSYCI